MVRAHHLQQVSPSAPLHWARPEICLACGMSGFLALTLLVGAAETTADTNAPPIVLTNAQQIVTLGTNIPAGRYEAHLKAVVFYVSAGNRRLYVQDGEVGVQVNLKGSSTGFRPGQVLELVGTVLSGEAVVRLANVRAKILSEGSLPDPKLLSVHHLVAGKDALRYVKVQGMVRDMYSAPSLLVLQVTQDGYPFEVVFYNEDVALPRHWMDAEVEITGFCYPQFGPNGRIASIRYFATSTNDVRILTPGIADRFEGRPLLTIAEASKLPNSLKQRYRIAGTVLVHRPGIVFFIDDGTGVMLCDTTLAALRPPPEAKRIERERQTTLEPGERVEVIGARHNWFSITPSMMATEYRRVGKAEPIRPIEVTYEELQQARHPGRLVTLKARLVDRRAWGSSSLRHYQSLVLRVDNDIFQALWESETPAKWDLPLDSFVKITGVNDAEGSPNRKRSTFKLLLRSPTDVVPVAEPPFWTRKEFQRIAVAMGGVALLAGAWIGMQRLQMRRLERRVKDRTTDLSAANENLQREVVQRRAAEGSLRASEARKAAVLESALDSIITIDQAGRILDFNPAAEKAFGLSREQVLGREMAELIIPPAWREKHRAGLRRAVTTGENSIVGKRVEVPALRSDGEEFPVELALSRITTESGPIFTAHIQDISERKRAEAERERALADEKALSELKGRFVSMVSHEFRTPLGIIASSAEILEAYLERLTPAERQSNIRDITDATRHMSRMMDEVLLLGRAEAGRLACQPGPLDLGAFGQRLVDEITAATNGRCPIRLLVASRLGEAQADEGLLRHIFTNLLNNATKYSPAGSVVEFRIEARGRRAVFTVRDEGIGIPDADARLLFQAFHRGRNVGDTPGTGLGMTIVKRCVELHGGKITFESKEGRGTTFVVALPVFAFTDGPEANTTQITPADIGGRNVTPVS